MAWNGSESAVYVEVPGDGPLAREIEIPPRDCFKYYVQVDGAPKTILWNFATKKKNIAFGLFFQLSSDSLGAAPDSALPAAPAPTPVTAVPADPVAATPAIASPGPGAGARRRVISASAALNLNFSSASSARSSPRHSPAASLSGPNTNPFSANHAGALVASPHLEVPPSSSDAGGGGGSSMGIADSSDADTVVNGGTVVPPPIVTRQRAKSTNSAVLPREPLLEPILPVQRYESSKSTVKGQQLVMRDGTYVLYFDNTFSRNTSKKMTFFVAMRDGEAPKEDQAAPELTGWLLKKKRKRMQGWAKRYFTCDRGQLSYMKLPGGFCRGSVPIALSTISVDPDHRIINIDSGTTLWHLRAFTREDYDKWIAVIKRYKAEHAEVVRAVAAAATAGPPPTMPMTTTTTTTSPISDHQTIRATHASSSPSSPTIDHLMRQFIASVDSHVDHLARLVLTANPSPAPELVNTVKALAQVLHAEKDELLDQLACESAKAATVAQAYAEILRENAELRARFDGAGGAPSMSASGSATVVPPPQPARAMTPPGYHPTSSASLTAAQQQVVAAHRSLSMTSFSAANRISGSVGPAGMHMRTGSIASTISDQWFDAEEIVLSAASKAGGAKGKTGDGSESESSDDSDQRSVKGKAAAAKRVSAMAAGKTSAGRPPMSPEMVVYEAGVDATSPSSLSAGPDSSAAADARGTGTGEGTDDEEDEDEDDEYAYDDDDDDDDDESGYMVDVYNGVASPTGGAAPRSLRAKRSASSLGSKSTRNVSVFQGGYHVARRQYLPSPVVGDDVSLLGILRKNVGKDLSTVAMPISLNEPINLLQKLAEELEYSHLLDRAAATQPGDSMHRLYLVAAFAVSSYASTANRNGRKPFNPLHGETYELVRPDRGFRFVSEKVSHQPAIMACHATSLPVGKWSFFQDSRLKSKFWGKSMELIPVGNIHVELPEHGEHYTWTKVTTCMRNLIGGPKSLDHYGKLVVVNHATKERVEITFKENGGGGWLGGGPSTANEVVGVGYSGKGDKVGVIRGRWSELCTVSRPGADDEGQVLWRANPVLPHCDQFYGFTQFTIELNEMTPDVQEFLPPTDTRFRPDQADFERGVVEAAEAEKIRLEEKQRQYRKQLQEEGKEWVPQWFEVKKDPFTKEEEWQYRGGYWETREKRAWGNPIDLWGPSEPAE